MSKRIRVLIVDDSAVVRRILTKALSSEPDIEVVGAAADPFEARDQIASLRPDVMTLDIEMPKMDGLTFLSKLMAHFPMPVIVVSSIAQRNSVNAVRALQLGAVEVVPKPGSEHSAPDVANSLARAVRVAAVSKARATPSAPAKPLAAPAGPKGPIDPCRIIAFGSSTGGVQALEMLVARLPAYGPPVVSTQHIPDGFVDGLAKRLDAVSAVRCMVAQDNMLLEPGTYVIAPGHSHLSVEWDPRGYRAKLDQRPPVNSHRPSVDVLFHSVAKCPGSIALGVILTGMGGDGADGLLAMRRAGAHTIAEAEESCVVFGMPRVAIERGAAVQTLHRDNIPAAIVKWIHEPAPARAARARASAS